MTKRNAPPASVNHRKPASVASRAHTQTNPLPTPPANKFDFTAAALAAWHGQLNLLTLFEVSNTFSNEGQRALAAMLYQIWLQRNQTEHNHLALFNLGVILFDEQDYAGALAVYSRALQQAPHFLQPRFNLGLTHERMGNSAAATAAWLWIVNHAAADNPEQRPFLLLALNNLGRHHEDQQRYAEALAALSRSLQIEPDQPDVVHHWVFLRAKQCLWPVYEALPGLPVDKQQAYTSALAMISLSEDPEMQLAAARNYVKQKITSRPPLAPGKAYAHKKIRLGYCSSDLCMHPVAMLTVELFELHDRDQFEVYVYDWSREDNSSLRRRVIAAADHFERIHALDDESAARLIRQHEIDILIDLHGQTLGARANLLAWRPAPVQITYLGLPATTGLPSIDYVIADRYLIPEDAQAYYSEKPLYLPDVYQPSDRQRVVAAPPTRKDCGLPEDAFVFCSFNNNYKFTDEMFRAWLRILNQVPGSVLWLLADNPWAEDNLKREALAANVELDRLIFAPRVLPEHYLARYAVADLFLDTYPFNAGTTANDALWMGLPVLTRSGKTFASRMAGALLTAAGLPELIGHDLASYEAKAIALGNDPARCRQLRQQLAEVRQSGVLFDTPRLTRNLESIFKTLV